jgi:hypothetical protein
MLARGELCSNIRGIIGRLALVSAHRQRGKDTAKVTSDAMMNGCDPDQKSLEQVPSQRVEFRNKTYKELHCLLDSISLDIYPC